MPSSERGRYLRGGVMYCKVLLQLILYFRKPWKVRKNPRQFRIQSHRYCIIVIANLDCDKPPTCKHEGFFCRRREQQTFHRNAKAAGQISLYRMFIKWGLLSTETS